MRKRGLRKILAVDVGSEDETDFGKYGDDLNGFYLRPLSYPSKSTTSKSTMRQIFKEDMDLLKNML